MNNMIQPKEKSTVIVVFLLIITAIFINNLSGRKNYDDLNRNISSIYKDRLMPANYLFQFNDHLYQKKLLLQQRGSSIVNTTVQLSAHNKIIDGLIKEYETTYLTKAEKVQWNNFRQNLLLYNKAEMQLLSKASITNNIDNSFNNALLSLNNLNAIQATEGKLLQKSSQAIIGGTVISSYFEISMLFILSVIAFVLITKLGKDENDTHILPKKYLYN